MESPLVTVVTPSYNQGEFIRATIESLLSQDYPHIEYIIMDGGSTDQTAAVVRDYASRLTFISEKDRGQSHAINKGFQKAHGTILSWLNSDDVYLPGAVRKAVECFERSPQAGAVYGEGYLMDRRGEITSRFPCTEPLNLWKLVYLSDYILQQTVYFRKAVLDDIGYLEEDLHYTMDWDVLIRIAKKYRIEYIPEYLGCLREYPEAKSFSGGSERIRELHRLLKRHTGLRLPPGSIVYGLDTYHRIWCAQVERLFGRLCRPLSNRLQGLIRLASGLAINHTVQNSQGLYSDGWAGPVLRYMLPPPVGPLLVEGWVPGRNDNFHQQLISVKANGVPLKSFLLSAGDFRLEIGVPPELHNQSLLLEIRASSHTIPARFSLRGDRRRLAYKLSCIGYIPATAPRLFLREEQHVTPRTNATG